MYVILCSMCENNDGDKKPLDAHFEFEDEELYELHDGLFYDDLIPCFNKWLELNGHSGWFVDDAIEPVRVISQEEAINPYRVTHDMGTGYDFKMH